MTSLEIVSRYEHDWIFCFVLLQQYGSPRFVHRSPFTVTIVPRRLFFFFFHPIYYPRTTLALPPSSNSDPGSHSGPSSPLPTKVRAFIFYREKNSAFSPLVDSRRIVYAAFICLTSKSNVQTVCSMRRCCLNHTRPTHTNRGIPIAVYILYCGAWYGTLFDISSLLVVKTRRKRLGFAD